MSIGNPTMTRSASMAKGDFNALRREDEEPWYRQFWPWFLIALPGSVVIAALSTVYIANRHADDLVVDDYYKDGLAINVQLEKQQRASELGISAEIRVLAQRVQVRLQGARDEVGALNLLLSHPLDVDSDFSLALSPVAPGLYVGEMPTRAQPNWHWTLYPEAGDWRLDGSLASRDFLDPSGSTP